MKTIDKYQFNADLAYTEDTSTHPNIQYPPTQQCIPSSGRSLCSKWSTSAPTPTGKRTTTSPKSVSHY